MFFGTAPYPWRRLAMSRRQGKLKPQLIMAIVTVTEAEVAAT